MRLDGAEISCVAGREEGDAVLKLSAPADEKKERTNEEQE